MTASLGPYSQFSCVVFPIQLSDPERLPDLDRKWSDAGALVENRPGLTTERTTQKAPNAPLLIVLTTEPCARLIMELSSLIKKTGKPTLNTCSM